MPGKPLKLKNFVERGRFFRFFQYTIPMKNSAQNLLAPLSVCLYGHPALRRESTEIPTVTRDLSCFAENMVDAMNEHEGIGLAAPQVGQNINLVALDVPSGHCRELPGGSSPGELMLLPRMPLVLINLHFTPLAEETASYSEGCLSIPGINADIVRPLHIQLQAQTLTGEKLDVPCSGLLARCLQHEIDHLHGVLFIDRADEGSRIRHRRALKKLEKETRKALRF